MKVRAIERYYYSRREYQPGEIVDVDDREEGSINILCALGKLERVKDESSKRPENKPEVTKIEETIKDDYVSQAIKVEDEEDSPRRRTYRRRDMRAEK